MGYSTTYVSKEILKNIKRFAYVSIPSASASKFIIGNAFAVLKKYYKDIANVQVAYDKSGTEFYALVTLKNGDWFEIEASEMVGVNPGRNWGDKTIIIRKRTNLKYMPSYKWETIGTHGDGMGWFNTSHKNKTEAVESVNRLVQKFPNIKIIQENPAGDTVTLEGSIISYDKKHLVGRQKLLPMKYLVEFRNEFFPGIKIEGVGWENKGETLVFRLIFDSYAQYNNKILAYLEKITEKYGYAGDGVIENWKKDIDVGRWSRKGFEIKS